MIATDTYYRGYRLSRLREGTPTETVHIRWMGQDELIAAVPTLDQAKSTIDEWLRAR